MTICVDSRMRFKLASTCLYFLFAFPILWKLPFAVYLTWLQAPCELFACSTLCCKVYRAGPGTVVMRKLLAHNLVIIPCGLIVAVCPERLARGGAATNASINMLLCTGDAAESWSILSTRSVICGCANGVDISGKDRECANGGAHLLSTVPCTIARWLLVVIYVHAYLRPQLRERAFS